ncbi:MAG TPA: HepT-like ribonuclease domain-containing protein [Thermoanaerobaculia bacterium]|nr:HepT-like ribonuclease domain-containing protein [Thermoanaerobaculia bacterium]
MTPREQQYLLDILLAAEDALSFVAGLSFDEFASNALVRRAVLQCLSVIGEAAARITKLAEGDVPDLPWQKMKNLRNVIVHDYEGVNLPIIWQIVTAELPKVVATLSPRFLDRGR